METQVKERLTGAVILVALIVLLVPELLTGGARPVTSRAVEAAGTEGEPALRTLSIDLVQGGVQQQDTADTDLTARSVQKAPLDVVPRTPVTESLDTPAGPPVEPQASPPLEAAIVRPEAEKPVASPEVPVPDVAKPEPGALKSAQPVSKPVVAKAAVKAAPAIPEHAQKATASGSGWAVQLGSFASRDNAQRLVNQLKGKGYSAFVLSGGGSSGKLYRVRVGPQSSRSAADAVATRLRTAGHKGAVVSQP